MKKTTDSMLLVIGASAGGMAALKKLVAQFPENFPAPIFIVNHMSAENSGEALWLLDAAEESALYRILRMHRIRTCRNR